MSNLPNVSNDKFDGKFLTKLINVKFEVMVGISFVSSNHYNFVIFKLFNFKY